MVKIEEAPHNTVDRSEYPFQKDDLVFYHNFLAYVSEHTHRNSSIVRVYNATCLVGGFGHHIGDSLGEKSWPLNEIKLFGSKNLINIAKTVKESLRKK